MITTRAYLAAARAGQSIDLIEFGCALAEGLLPQGANVLVSVEDTPTYLGLAETEICDRLDTHGVESVGAVAGRLGISPRAVVARGNSYRVAYRGKDRTVTIRHIASYDDPGKAIDAADQN